MKVSTSSGKLLFSGWREIWSGEEAQGIAEYAVMFAVILVIGVGVLRLIGGDTNHMFSAVARIFRPVSE